MIFKYNSLTDRLSRDETISHIAKCFDTLRVEYKSAAEDSILATHFGKDRDLDLYLTRNEIMELGEEGQPIDTVLAEITIKRGDEELFRDTYMVEDIEKLISDLWDKEYIIELDEERE